MGTRLTSAIILLAFIMSSYILYVQGYLRVVGISDYVSDEVWYVSASVNIARSILGLEITPRVNSSYALYTVFYNASRCTSSMVVEELNTTIQGLAVAKQDYRKVYAVAFYVPLGESRAFLESSQRLDCIVDVMPGLAPDHENINTYLNAEHPPLVKYILALTLWVGGWRSWVWRLPSLLMGFTLLATLAYTVHLVSKRYSLKPIHVVLLSLLLVVYTWRDPVVSAMSSVAMLDIYATGFDALTVLALATGRPLAAAVFLGLAGASKYTGLFLYPVLLLAILLDSRLDTRRKILVITTPLIVLVIAWTPFILVKGASWVYGEIIRSLEWHTTSRPQGPPTTTPLGLLLGCNGFALYYKPTGEPLLTATCNPGICALGLVAGILSLLASLILVCSRRMCSIEEYTTIILSSAMPFAWLGYLIVYLAGNKTLYSFYSIQLSALGLQALLTLPFLTEILYTLKPKNIVSCVSKPYTTPVLAVLASILGISVSLLLTHGVFREKPVNPSWSPIYIMLGESKAEKLLLVATAYTLYSIAAYRFTGWRDRLSIARWLLAGTLVFISPATVFLPVTIALLASSRRSLVDGVAAGLLSPSPIILGLASAIPGVEERRSVLVGLSVGLIAVLATTSLYHGLPIFTGWYTTVLGAAILASILLLVYAPLPSAIPVGLTVLFEPSMAPLLVFAEIRGEGRGVVGFASAILATLGLAIDTGLVRLAGLGLFTAGVIDYYAVKKGYYERGSKRCCCPYRSRLDS